MALAVGGGTLCADGLRFAPKAVWCGEPCTSASVLMALLLVLPRAAQGWTNLAQVLTPPQVVELF